MHRMRYLLPRAGWVLALACLFDAPAAAELIQPRGGRAYPEIAGAITGTQTYTFDPATRTGLFQMTNTPFLLTAGPSASNEVIVQPNLDGVRSQVVNLTLDQAGRLVSSPTNSYSVYGTVVVGGRTFQGLLLEGTPTAFGAESGASAVFNLDLKVTGGALAQAFGPELHMELHPAHDSSFDGSFAKSFRTRIDYSNTLGYHASRMAGARESTGLVVLFACGAGLWLRRHRRRFAGRELVAIA